MFVHSKLLNGPPRPFLSSSIWLMGCHVARAGWRAGGVYLSRARLRVAPSQKRLRVTRFVLSSWFQFRRPERWPRYRCSSFFVHHWFASPHQRQQRGDSFFDDEIIRRSRAVPMQTPLIESKSQRLHHKKLYFPMQSVLL